MYSMTGDVQGARDAVRTYHRTTQVHDDVLDFLSVLLL